MAENSSLTQMYNHKYASEQSSRMALFPDRWSTSRYDDVARLLRGEKGSLLEVGCGGGQLVLALADQFDQLTGFDLASVRIAAANEGLQRYPQYAGKIRFVTGSADAPFPFDDGSFDVVVCCAVLEHVVDVFQAMFEIARVCRPNGCVVLTVPNICYIKHVRDLLLGRVPLTGSPTRDIRYWHEHGWDGGHFHCFSKSTLTDLLQYVGFTPEAWTGDGFLAKLRRWYTNFVGNLTVRARRRPN